MNLVTGGAGFIGSHLVAQLVERGERVRVLDLPAARTGHLPLDRIEWLPGDVRNREQVRAAVRGCRTVFHLAANPNLWARNRADFDAVNRLGTVHVLEEAIAQGAEAVVHTSTESILGSATENGLPVEERELCRDEMIGPYCRSKFEAEQVAARLARAGAPVYIVSPTLPVGPGDWGQSPPTRMSVAFCRGRLPAYLACRLNIIDVRDVAAGMQLVLDRGRPGRRYVLGAYNLDLREWLRLLARATRRAPPRWSVPYWLALAIAYANEAAADWWTGQMPQATVTGVRLTRRKLDFDTSATLAELGLRPRPIEESIHDAVEWFRRVGWIAGD